MKRSRGAIAVAILAMALSACGAASTNGSENDADGPIKVALIPPTSGSLAQFGTDSVAAWQVAADLANSKGGINGRKVQLIIKSTDGDPATTLRVAREAVTKDGAQFIGGVVTSPENSALNAQLPGLNVLAFNSLGQDDALVGEQCSAYSFHITQSTGMHIAALAGSIAELPGDKWAIQGVDYSSGHTAADAFKKAAEKAGKEVVLEQFAPLGTTDFGTYISKIKQSGADAIAVGAYGADGVAFLQQTDQFNLDAQMKTVVGLNTISEPLFESLGDSIMGYYNNVGYDPGLKNPENEEFVQAYTEATGTPPYYVSADNYLAAETLFAGIEEAGSTDPEEVRTALEGLEFDSIAGPVTMRAADHQLMRPDYLGKVVKDGGQLAFEIVSSAAAEETLPTPDPACEM